MSLTTTYSGTLQLSTQASAALSGDETGNVIAKQAAAVTYSPAGGSAPTLSGSLVGSVSPSTATDYLLAASTAPFGQYSPGFNPASTKIKEVYFRNNDPTNSVTVARKSANGAPIFDSAGDSVTLQPGGICLHTFPTGTAALVTGSNDGITITPSAGTPEVDILVKYGP